MLPGVFGDGCRVQPTALRFRGQHKLQVRSAPEPKNVKWINLHTSDAERFARRMVTTLLTVMLLATSFVVIYTAKLQKQEFSANVPKTSLCSELPGVLSGQTLRPRPMDSDAACAAFGNPRTRYALHVNASATVAAPNPAHALLECVPDLRCLAAGAWSPDTECTPGTGDTSCAGAECAATTPASCLGVVPCAQLGAVCIDPDGARTAAAVADAAAGSGITYEACAGSGGTEVAAPSLFACYCMGTLRNAVERDGLFTGAEKVMEDEACRKFVEVYLGSLALVVGAAVLIAVVNFMLKALLSKVVRFERHVSATSENASLMMKIFNAQFLNTCMLVIVTNAKLPPVLHDLLSWMTSLGLFNGDHEDFDASWYVDVAAALTLAMVLNIVVPHVVPLLKLLVLGPCKRWRARRQPGTCLTQEQLNAKFLGPPFKLAARFPFVLNAVFVSMALASGVPVLMPIAAVTLFVIFWVDKVCLLRLYRRPPTYGVDLPRRFARALVYALLLHARHDSAEDFSRLKAARCTAMAWVFIPAYCFAIS